VQALRFIVADVRLLISMICCVTTLTKALQQQQKLTKFYYTAAGKYDH